MSEQPQPTPSNESKLFGVSIRSWNATAIIIIGTGTLSYLAILNNEAAHVMALVTGAVGFLFGKASGLQQGAK